MNRIASALTILDQFLKPPKIDSLISSEVRLSKYVHLFKFWSLALSRFLEN